MMKPSEIRLEMIDPRPKDQRGGQHSGSYSLGVKATHIETGLSAQCGTERSTYKNRAVAEAMLEYGLLEIGVI